MLPWDYNRLCLGKHVVICLIKILTDPVSYIGKSIRPMHLFCVLKAVRTPMVAYIRDVNLGLARSMHGDF